MRGGVKQCLPHIPVPSFARARFAETCEEFQEGGFLPADWLTISVLEAFHSTSSLQRFVLI